MKNRILVLLMAAAMTAAAVSGCGTKDGSADGQPDDGKIHAMPEELFTSEDTEYTFYSRIDGVSPAEAEGGAGVSFCAYVYEKFAAEDIDSMKEGDVIAVNMDAAHPEEHNVTDVTVETVENTGLGGVIVNGDFENGGFYLASPSDQEYYYVIASDDYKFLYPYADGEKEFPPADDFVFVDNSDFEHPDQEYDFDGFLEYYEANQGDLYNFNTVMTVQNGTVKKIERTFIP